MSMGDNDDGDVLTSMNAHMFLVAVNPGKGEESPPSLNARDNPDQPASCVVVNISCTPLPDRLMKPNIH